MSVENDPKENSISPENAQKAETVKNEANEYFKSEYLIRP